MEQMLTVCGTPYRLLRLLGRGKGGYSYLAEGEPGQVVLKQIHHEPCAYYSFGLRGFPRSGRWLPWPGLQA